MSWFFVLVKSDRSLPLSYWKFTRQNLQYIKFKQVDDRISYFEQKLYIYFLFYQFYQI